MKENSENRFNDPVPLPDPELVFRTHDHPEANGRQPQPGESAWTFHFGLEDGRALALHGGRMTRQLFRDMLAQEEADDVAERLLGGEPPGAGG